ncbi:aminoacyl-tRNA hydrolase [Patescibacteria group bacterium]|nr:aminoacyl-tRNA hydrolase [Patescibacteria group bacterium]MBU2259059.1 aminoacyl-tRNA hydrolase [Patescibacteria group bacterium]
MKPSLVIIGLGNPGASYEKTRHNTGFQAADVLAEEFGAGDWKEKTKFNAFVMEGRIVTVPVLIAKPLTYMNRSGEAAKKMIDFYDLDPSKQLLIICDDIDLELGETRLREKGGPGTHNGLKSLVDVFGEDFPRLRFGIGAQPAGEDLSNWVLSAPSKEEAEKIKDAVKTVPELVKEFVLGL